MNGGAVWGGTVIVNPEHKPEFLTLRARPTVSIGWQVQASCIYSCQVFSLKFLFTNNVFLSSVGLLYYLGLILPLIKWRNK